MTNEEAVRILRRIQEPEAWEPQINGAAFEALDMAIEALGTNLAGAGTDLISRAAAQTELQLSARRYTVAHEAHGEGQVVWSELLISVSDAMNVLRKLPSAQPEIIQCKDCAWWTKQEDSPQGRCALLQIYPTGEWFCGNAGREVTE